MLAKEFRLPASIRLSQASTTSLPLFLCKYKPNGLPNSRFGFVVRKTVDKRATERNRVRRVFRSIIEELLPELQSGYDVLFVLNRPLLEMTREELYNTLYGFLKEKRLIR